jgi:hypothetical protein
MRRLAACVLLVSCGCTNPVDPSGNGGGGNTTSCASYAGNWTAVHVDQCGNTVTIPVTATQNQCTVSVAVPNIGDFVIGVSAASRVATVTKGPSCDGIQLPGAADEVTADRLHVVYGTGPDGCCRHGGLTLRK